MPHRWGAVTAMAALVAMAASDRVAALGEHGQAGLGGQTIGAGHHAMRGADGRERHGARWSPAHRRRRSLARPWFKADATPLVAARSATNAAEEGDAASLEPLAATLQHLLQDLGPVGHQAVDAEVEQAVHLDRVVDRPDVDLDAVPVRGR